MIWYLKFVLLIFSGCLDNKTNRIEKTRPASAQYKKADDMFVNRITFFIKMASVPEKIRAKNRNKVDLLKKIFELVKKKVPNIIKNIPKISREFGISFNKKNPNINATMGL